MPGVTQKTERPGRFNEKMDAMIEQWKNRRRNRRATEKDIEEYKVVCTKALITSAEDKIEFSLNGAIRRGQPKKMGVSESEFSDLWRSKMKNRLKIDGFPFKLTKEEKTILAKVTERTKKERTEEMTKLTAAALSKIIS